MKIKTETKKEKDFDTVKTFRAIKEKISKEITNMDAKQIQSYLKDKKVRLQNWPQVYNNYARKGEVFNFFFRKIKTGS